MCVCVCVCVFVYVCVCALILSKSTQVEMQFTPECYLQVCFSLFVFYVISTLVGYLMLNPVYLYPLNPVIICLQIFKWFSVYLVWFGFMAY